MIIYNFKGLKCNILTITSILSNWIIIAVSVDLYLINLYGVKYLCKILNDQSLKLLKNY